MDKNNYKWTNYYGQVKQKKEAVKKPKPYNLPPYLLLADQRFQGLLLDDLLYTGDLVPKLGHMTTISDLPEDLEEDIFSRVPSTSLSAVRSTCKKWNALSKNWIFGKAAAARKQFMGFMMMDYRVCSLRLDLQDIRNKGDFVDISIKQVSMLDQVEISQVFHCEGLLLCVTRDSSRLLVWNPYLGQARWIQPRNSFHTLDRYALGYDNNRNHKIWVCGGHVLEIWVTNKIDPGAVSWSKFLTSFSGCQVDVLCGSFFIDEENEVAVVIDLDFYKLLLETHCNQTATIIGQDRYFKSVNIGVAWKLEKRGVLKTPYFCGPLVCSAYVPSSVQLQP